MAEQSPPPASPQMAERLAINRTGRLTPGQRRLALLVGGSAALFLLCPLALLIQLGAVMLWGNAPMPTIAGILLAALGVLFLLIFVGLIGINAWMFLPEAFMRQPVRYARGPLEVRVTAGHRPELPFSYLIGDYSFAPFVAPDDVPMRVGAPYLVYYSARSRRLLSLAALDAPDAAQWEPAFSQEE